MAGALRLKLSAIVGDHQRRSRIVLLGNDVVLSWKMRAQESADNLGIVLGPIPYNAQVRMGHRLPCTFDVVGAKVVSGAIGAYGRELEGRKSLAKQPRQCRLIVRLHDDLHRLLNQRARMILILADGGRRSFVGIRRNVSQRVILAVLGALPPLFVISALVLVIAGGNPILDVQLLLEVRPLIGDPDATHELARGLLVGNNLLDLSLVDILVQDISEEGCRLLFGETPRGHPTEVGISASSSDRVKARNLQAVPRQSGEVRLQGLRHGRIKGQGGDHCVQKVVFDVVQRQDDINGSFSLFGAEQHAIAHLAD